MTLTIYNAEDIPQGSDAWLEARRGIVTASTVGKLLTSTGKVANNDTSRALAETLALERLTGRVQYLPPTFDMRRGTALEDDARNIYAERYGVGAEVGFGRIDEDGYSFGASPDYLLAEQGGGAEFKCPKPSTHFRTILEGNVPRHYLPQIHSNMLVFDASWWDFMSHDPGQPPFVKRVYRSTEWDELITASVRLAEENITALVGAYLHNTRNTPTTPYWDPMADEEEITFG